ncbi:MAG: LysM peptidoglycan-binding domain-containing protein [Ginsengibacter sp.]
MITSGFGKLDKLNIEAFTDKAFSKTANKKFAATINPETYTTRHKIEFCDTQASGTSMPILKFNKITAQEVNLDFLFDSTGIIKDATPKSIAILNPLDTSESVADQIDKFRDTIIDYQGDIHRPYFLKICWGTLLFKCVLVNLDIEYKLFKPDGMPVRAVAKCTFKGTVEEGFRKAKEKKQSPDVTHERLLKSEDKISLLTYRIYNEQKYLIPVATFNHLDGFRDKRAGTTLYFPPVE